MERAIIIITRLYSTVQHFTQRKYKHLSRNTRSARVLNGDEVFDAEKGFIAR